VAPTRTKRNKKKKANARDGADSEEEGVAARAIDLTGMVSKGKEK